MCIYICAIIINFDNLLCNRLQCPSDVKICSDFVQRYSIFEDADDTAASKCEGCFAVKLILKHKKTIRSVINCNI